MWGESGLKELPLRAMCVLRTKSQTSLSDQTGLIKKDIIGSSKGMGAKGRELEERWNKSKLCML